MDSTKHAEVQSEPFLEPDSKSSKRGKEKQKWRRSLRSFVALATLVLFVNTIFLIVAVSRHPTFQGKGTLYEASCSHTRWVNVGFHVVINILSTMLLAASNYCMQCLSAPTRSEINAAHSKARFLDIGVPSFHNIRSPHFDTRKRICWWVLALSSFPLHLCYNSVVFTTVSTRGYVAMQFNSTVKTAIENGTYTPTHYDPNEQVRMVSVFADALKNGSLEEISARDCIDAYSQPFQSTRGNVVLIPVDDTGIEDDGFDGSYSHVSRSETCSAETGGQWVYNQFQSEPHHYCFQQDSYVWRSRLQANVSDWRPFNARIDHCMSQAVEQPCKLNFSIHLAVIVIIFNVLKLSAIIASMFILRETPLLTIGDAAASFLRDPDPFTADMSLISQKDIHRLGQAWTSHQQSTAYTDRKHRWVSSVKRGKRITCILAVSTGILVLIILLVWGYTVIKGTKSFATVLKIGFGATEPRTIIQSGTPSFRAKGILANVLLANSPQIILSLLYFSYNAAFTSMLLAQEWSGHFERSKGLRVSAKPVGQQRSTYFLQLPVRYAIPLMVFSTLLHWLASESIFVVSVEIYNMFGQHDPRGNCHHFPYSDGYTPSCGTDFVTCAYNPLAIFLAFIVACLLAIAIVVLGWRKLNPMPVVGSCSVAIAASCHAGLGEDTPWEKKLQWGAIEGPEEAAQDGVGHCGLSSGAVTRPVVGRLYA